MKIVTDIQKPDKEAEIREIPKSKILLAQIKPKKGQFVWQFNMRTKELVRKTAYETHVNLNGAVNKKIEREPDCLYCAAINRENAAKKIMRLLDELENI